MARVEREITIDAPADRVFSYVADFTRHPEWASQQLQIEQTSEGAVGQGATFKSVGHQFGEKHDAITVTEYAPNTSIVFECEGNAGKIRHSFSLQEQDGSTTLAKAMEPLQTAGTFKLLAPIVMTFVTPGAMSKDLQNIKKQIEEQGSSSEAPTSEG